MKPFVTYNEEKNKYPVIVSLPHSGTWLPAEMQNSLRQGAVLANTDWFLPELYHFFAEKGCTVIENRVNRYVVDPNRESRMQGSDYRDTAVYQQNTFGHQLYKNSLSAQTIDERLEHYYWPYHQALEGLIEQKKAHFSKVYLLDLHSFAEYPSDAESVPADFVIGNQADQTASTDSRKLLTFFLEEAGYRVSNNYPFRGGFITRHHGRAAAIEALQLEIRYNRYIDQRSFGEEEVAEYDLSLFLKAQNRLETVFEKWLNQLLSKNQG